MSRKNSRRKKWLDNLVEERRKQEEQRRQLEAAAAIQERKDRYALRCKRRAAVPTRPKPQSRNVCTRTDGVDARGVRLYVNNAGFKPAEELPLLAALLASTSPRIRQVSQIG